MSLVWQFVTVVCVVGGLTLIGLAIYTIREIREYLKPGPGGDK